MNFSHLTVCRCILFFLCLLAVSFLWADDIRTFTSIDGQKIEATVVNYNPADGQVVIRRSDNQKFTVPYDRFSAEDQAYLDAWREEYDRSFVFVDMMGVRVRSSRIFFLIDQSAGLDGADWNRFIKIIEPIILNLKETTDFNVAGVGTSYFHKSLLPANTKNKLEAINWLKERGSLPDSSVFRALDTAYNHSQADAVVIITDGVQVSNQSKLLEAVTKWNADRETPLAIYVITLNSNGGDDDILRELAELTGGEFARR